MKNKTIFLFSLLLSLSLVACGGGGEDESADTVVSNTASSSSSDSADDGEGIEEPISTCVLAVNADCSGANFAGQDLASVIAPGVNLRGANLTDAILDLSLIHI